MEDFVTYDVAVKLKEKGFKEECLAYYTTEYTLYNNMITLTDDKYLHVSAIDYEEFLVSHNSIKYTNGNYVDAPTISQVLKWLREEKKIFVTINIGYCYESDEIPFPTNPKMEPILKGYYYGIWELDNLNDKNGRSEYFETPELAALAGIKYTIDNLI